MINSYHINGLPVQRFVFPYINSNMYVIAEQNEALVIDPHISSEALSFLTNIQVQKLLILLTHEHPDHTSGVTCLQRFFNTKLICQKYCAEAIAVERNNRPLLISFILAAQDEQNGTCTAQKFNDEFPIYCCKANDTFQQNMALNWMGHKINLTSIPGHSPGSAAIMVDEKIIFSGDSLLKDFPVITRFPGGNTKIYETITLPFFKELKGNITCFPGHGNIFTLEEIFRHV